MPSGAKPVKLRTHDVGQPGCDQGQQGQDQEQSGRVGKSVACSFNKVQETGEESAGSLFKLLRYTHANNGYELSNHLTMDFV